MGKGSFKAVYDRRFIDELEGWNYANRFFDGIYSQLGDQARRLDCERRNLAIDRHIVDGGIETLWYNESPIATVSVIRTPNNWTHVVCVKIENRFLSHADFDFEPRFSEISEI